MSKIGLVSLSATLAAFCLAVARYQPGSPKSVALGSVLRLSGC